MGGPGEDCKNFARPARARQAFRGEPGASATGGRPPVADAPGSPGKKLSIFLQSPWAPAYLSGDRPNDISGFRGGRQPPEETTNMETAHTASSPGAEASGASP